MLSRLRPLVQRPRTADPNSSVATTGTADTGTEPQLGYSVVDVLDDELLCSLRDTYAALPIDPGHDFVATSNDMSRADARRVHEEILAILGDRLAEVVPGHEPFVAGFISKGPQSCAPTAFHQDLSYTDENRHRATLLWIPLIDVDETSGALRVIPGSHRAVDGVRPSGSERLPTASMQDELTAMAITVPLRAGQAVSYDPALVHGAHPNAAPVARPAVAVALAPAEAELVHVHVDDDGEGLTAYLVDVDYHFDQGLFHRPAARPTTRLWAEPVTEAALRIALHLPPAADH